MRAANAAGFNRGSWREWCKSCLIDPLHSSASSVGIFSVSLSLKSMLSISRDIIFFGILMQICIMNYKELFIIFSLYVARVEEYGVRFTRYCMYEISA